MNTLQKKKLRGTGVNCGLIVLLFAVVLLLGQVLPDNTYRRVLVPIIWQMCIFILLGTSLNLTLGYLGQLTLGHMGFAGIGAYTAALSSLALERAGVFEASKAAPGQLILVVLGCCLLGAVFAGLLGLLVGIPALRLRGAHAGKLRRSGGAAEGFGLDGEVGTGKIRHGLLLSDATSCGTQEALPQMDTIIMKIEKKTCNLKGLMISSTLAEHCTVISMTEFYRRRWRLRNAEHQVRNEERREVQAAEHEKQG